MNSKCYNMSHAHVLIQNEKRGKTMNLGVILQTGKQSLPIIICTISTSLVVAWILHKVMHIESNISTLISLFMQHMLNLWQNVVITTE